VDGIDRGRMTVWLMDGSSRLPPVNLTCPHREHDGDAAREAERDAAAGEPGEERRDHRRPRSQSSSRAWIVTAMPASAAATNTHRKVSRYGTSGRMAAWVSKTR
jgi:hypothetical protein